MHQKANKSCSLQLRFNGKIRRTKRGNQLGHCAQGQLIRKFTAPAGRKLAALNSRAAFCGFPYSGAANRTECYLGH